MPEVNQKENWKKIQKQKEQRGNTLLGYVNSQNKNRVCYVKGTIHQRAFGHYKFNC